MTKKEHAFNNLIAFKKILDSLGIPFWLDGGTLLGAFRDGDFCEDDENDVDLCTWMEFKDRRILERAEKEGFRIYHQWETQFAITKDGCKIDLFFNQKEEDNAFTYLYKGDKKDKKVVIPLRFYESLEPIEFKGAMFNRPCDVTDYLTLKYGNWMNKVHRSEYSCYNKENNKLVQDI